MILKENDTCLRVAKAPRASLLVDMACYFEAAKAAMRQARHSVHFLNWAFEPQTRFEPRPDCGVEEGDQIGNFLKALADEKPGLDIRVLCWRSAMPVAATQHFFPIADRRAFRGSRVHFVLDGRLPLGACHHQKMIIIDDNLAFCGGGDIGPDRWDTPEHLDDDPRREKTRRDSKCFDSRHEVMSVVDGDAAAALAEVFRDRWLRATGEAVEPCPRREPPAWPGCITPDFHDVCVGISRTHAAWRKYPEVREVERLHVASIAEARTLIYMESQYFTSPLVAEALAARLREPDGPEIVLISTEHSPSYFDQATMDKTRLDFIAHLQSADEFNRFRAYSPVTTLGRTIIVHSKLTIIDDRLLRIGSANINNRSMGFDTECDLSIEACGPTEAEAKAKIAHQRAHLLAHWLGCDHGVVTAAIEAEGKLTAALDHLRSKGYARLRPITAEPVNPLSGLIATYHVGDPVGADDAWRPWARREAVRRQLIQAGLDPREVRLTSQH